MALATLSIFYTWKTIKSTYINKKFKISAPKWNDTFDLPDGSYSISGIQDYFKFIIKKLINISLHSLMMMNTINTEFSFVEVWFTDQTSKTLEIEDNVNLTLIFG